MSNYRTMLVLAVAAALVIVAASLASAQYALSPITLPTLAPSAPVLTGIAPSDTQPTQTAAPTKTDFVFPTLAGSPAVLLPSDTPLPPTSAPLTTATPQPSDTPRRPTPPGLPPIEPPDDDPATPLSAGDNIVTAVKYTVAISDVFARREPELDSDLYLPLQRGQSYTLAARSSDGVWIRLELPKAQDEVWAPAAFGLISGSREAVPLAGPTLTPAPKPISPTAVLSPVVTAYPYISIDSARAREIYRYGLLLGNNPRAFIKIGDCQATYPFFLSAFDTKSYRLGGSYAYLQETISQFSGSFARNSAAAQTGFGTATVLDPTWANPEICQAGENPLVCEYRAMQPSLAVISLGTNDIWQPDGRHEKNMRQIIDYLIRHGVVPVLSTKADNVEGDGSFNRLMVQLAAEYQLPMWDYWQVTRSLPDYGLLDTYHLTWGPAIFDDPKNMLLGWPWRNLTALQALDAVWRSVR